MVGFGVPRRIVEPGGHTGSDFRSREESLMGLVLRHADEHVSRETHSHADAGGHCGSSAQERSDHKQR